MQSDSVVRGKKRVYRETDEASEKDVSLSVTRRKKIRTISIDQLSPFSFLIEKPPIVYMQFYSALSTYLEGAINNDFDVVTNPFVVNSEALRLWLEEPASIIIMQPVFDEAESTNPTLENDAIPVWERLVSSVNDPQQLTVKQGYS